MLKGVIKGVKKVGPKSRPPFASSEQNLPFNL